jgi:adenylate cyclase
MTAKQHRLLLKVIPYPLVFLLGGSLYTSIEYGMLGAIDLYPASGTPYDPMNSLLTVVPMSVLFGFILGIIEETIFKKRFWHMPFTLKIIIKTLLYISIFVALLLVFSILLNMLNSDLSITDPLVYSTILDFFTSYAIVSIVIFVSFIIAVGLFVSEIVDYLGLDVVGNFFSGKYSKPVYESRIFMFLDMKDSTTIAEKIGHKKHYALINEYYSDMTDAILETHGSIYQYVGDEIVISWNMEKGLDRSSCLRCFFLIEQYIEKRAARYQTTYGVVPTFKASLHCGEVTRGIVGQVKRELLYTGDVLNSTARIQGLCNQLGEKLLVSSNLKKLLPENNFKFKPQGDFELRGRLQKEAIFSVSH